MLQGVMMVKILVDLSENEDKIVEVYKIMNNLKTKQEAVKEMVKYFEAEIKPKNIEKKQYFK